MGDKTEKAGKMSENRDKLSDEIKLPPQPAGDSSDDSDATSDSEDATSSDESANLPRGNEKKSISSPWKRLFQQNRNLVHGLKLRKVEKEDVVHLLDSDVLDTKSIWEATLIGYVVGKPMEAKDIDALRRAWNISFNYMKHPSGWIIFKFDTEEQKQAILANGPYSSSGFPWIMKDIPPYFSFGDESFSYIPVWVTLPGLPMECWSESALSKITTHIGDPITTDKCTALKFRVSFARVLVEIDARKELVRNVPIKMPNGDLHNQSVLYEFEPKLCATCKRVGHSTSDCRSTKKPRGMKVGAASQRNNYAITESMKFANPSAKPCLVVTQTEEVSAETLFGPSPSEAYSKKATTAAKVHATNSAKGPAVNAPTAAKGNGANAPTAAKGVGANVPNAAKGVGANAPNAAKGVGANAPIAVKEIGANAPTVANGNGANAPTVAKGIGANAPTAAKEIGANAPTAAKEIGANAPTAAKEIGANAPTAVMEIGANAPTAANVIGATAAKKYAANVATAATQNSFGSLGVVGEILHEAIQPIPSTSNDKQKIDFSQKGASTSKKNKKNKN